MDDIPFAKAIPVIPYAGPHHDPGEPAFWANGPFLVMRIDATLPDRCIKCNCPAGGRNFRKRLIWADTQKGSARSAMRYIPFVRIFTAFGSMFRWFGDLRTARAPVVSVGICPRHRFAARAATCIAYLALPLSLTIFWTAAPEILKLWVPVIGLFASAIVWTRPRPIKAVHMGIGFVTLAGVGGKFLQSLRPRLSQRRG